MKRILLSAVMLLMYSGLSAQDYPLPIELKGKPLLSSNFGELRNLNLHAGIDIKTGGVEGLKIISVADGYVSRIAVKPFGYGKVIYITQDDGRMAVYAHLSSFSPELEAYIRTQRYKQEAGSVDLYPPRHMFPVRKGDEIGRSGNTGRSYGPHLHFEMREANSGRVINPLKYADYEVADNLPPEIINLYYFEVDTLSGVPVHRCAAIAAVVRNSAGFYSLDSPLRLAGKGYFALEVTDRKNNTSNTMGIYRITLRADERPVFEYRMDGFTYPESSYASSMSVYPLHNKTRNEVYRLAAHRDVKLPFYRNVVNRGVIDPSVEPKIVIEVEDDACNVSTFSFDIGYDPSGLVAVVEVPTDADVVDCRKEFTKKADALTVTIPAGALHEPVFYRQYKMAGKPAVTHDSSIKVISDYYVIHDPDIPLHSNITVSIVPDSTANAKGAVLARVGANGKLTSAGGKYANGRVSCGTKNFGVYCVAADTSVPVIRPSFKSGADMTGAKSLSFAVSDNFSGVASYRATVDGKWVILEHDSINDRLTHFFDDAVCGTGRVHTIKLYVRDGAGNLAEYSGEYTR